MIYLAYCNNAYSAESHCKNESQIIFNCHIENSRKVLSVCLYNRGQNEQYLQYLFGQPGNVELLFPKQKDIKEHQFIFERQYSRNAGWREYDLNFEIAHNKYNLYWMESSKTDGVALETPEINSGINVSTSSGKSIVFKCDSNVIENFDATYGVNVTENEP